MVGVLACCYPNPLFMVALLIESEEVMTRVFDRLEDSVHLLVVVKVMKLAMYLIH